MDNFFVTLQYNGKKTGMKSFHLNNNSLETNLSNRKFIKLNYNRKNGSSKGNSQDLKSESESNYQQFNQSQIFQNSTNNESDVNKNSSPPPVTSKPTNTIESTTESEYDINSNNIRDIPFKNYKSALTNLFNYQIQYYESDEFNSPVKLPYDQLMDQEWLQDNQVVCDRLHLLREVYKVIQIVKKKNNQPNLNKIEHNWFDLKPQTSNLESDEDMKIIQVYSQNINLSEQDDDEGSSSNTDTSFLKKRRKVQIP